MFFIKILFFYLTKELKFSDVTFGLNTNLYLNKILFKLNIDSFHYSCFTHISGQYPGSIEVRYPALRLILFKLLLIFFTQRCDFLINCMVWKHGSYSLDAVRFIHWNDYLSILVMC